MDQVKVKKEVALLPSARIQTEKHVFKRLRFLLRVKSVQFYPEII